MPVWAERVKSHQVWQLLQNLGPAIDNAFDREGTDPEAMDGLYRLKSVLTFTGKRLAGSDPYLLQAGPMDSISNSIQAAIQEIQSFVADGNSGHITNANAQADAILLYLAQINVQLTTDDFVAAKESADTYRIGLDKVLQDVKKNANEILTDINALKTKVGEISSEVTSERTRLSTLGTDFQTQFLAAQESRSTGFADSQKERQDRFTTLFTDFTQKLGEQSIEFSKQRDDIVRLHQVEIEALKKQFVEESTKLRDEMLERKSEIEKLVGVIGNLGVTSGYLKTANASKYTVWVWQFVTVCAMIGLISIAYLAFLPAVRGEFTWSGFAGRVFVSLTVGVLAAYAASQADKYQKIERQNRRLALELEAIGPFIAPLPQDKQEAFRLTIGDRSFGHGDGIHSGMDAKSPATVLDMLLESKQFRSFVTDLVKSTKP
jgi:predicted  nucleic acid-binding Zn-ribbon protein